MGAGRNFMKIIVGSALGATVGYAVNRFAERSEMPEDERMSLTEEVTSIPDRLKQRWADAQEAGEQARIAEEARLRAYFREKVNDPSAFADIAPPAPPAGGTRPS